MRGEIDKASDEMLSADLDCLYFDGQKDLTRTRMEVDGNDQVFYGLRREEHIAVYDSAGKYLTHFTPDEGTPVCH